MRPDGLKPIGRFFRLAERGQFLAFFQFAIADRDVIDAVELDPCAKFFERFQLREEDLFVAGKIRQALLARDDPFAARRADARQIIARGDDFRGLAFQKARHVIARFGQRERKHCGDHSLQVEIFWKILVSPGELLMSADV